MLAREPVRKFFQLATWVCVVLLAFLSWLPADVLIRTGADTRVEHWAAYAGTMICVVAGYGRLGPGLQIALLTGYAAMLELGQNFAPGRHPSLVDFAASCLGVLTGAMAFHVADRLREARRTRER